MEKLSTLYSTAVPLPIEDVDTDQIIPARFLKAVTREGFGENLFRDWRYDRNDNLIEDFVLNSNTYKGSILVAGRNFGCGSSREHAAWALYDHGFRVVISSFFADIFKGNALNNGLLPIKVSDENLIKIFEAIEKDPQIHFEVNVGSQMLTVESIGLSIQFELDEYKKMCLQNGYTDLDVLLNMKEKIASFEKEQVIY